MALAQLAAPHQGMSVSEWIARAARREVARIGPSSNYVELTTAEMLAEDAPLGSEGCSDGGGEVGEAAVRGEARVHVVHDVADGGTSGRVGAAE